MIPALILTVLVFVAVALIADRIVGTWRDPLERDEA